MTTLDNRPPSIEEMRRVARYLAETMELHSAAGKLLARAALLERIDDTLMKVKRHDTPT